MLADMVPSRGMVGDRLTGDDATTLVRGAEPTHVAHAAARELRRDYSKHLASIGVDVAELRAASGGSLAAPASSAPIDVESLPILAGGERRPELLLGEMIARGGMGLVRAATQLSL